MVAGVEPDRFDLIVIGGGINGAAIAREIALSGRTVLLVERDDIGCGTSAASTRLIHGGLRYLEFGEVGLVRESLAERERLLRHAPHLVEPLPLYLPLYRRRGRRPWQIRAGMWLYDLLSFDRSVPGHRMLDRAALLEKLPSLDRDGLVGGAGYYDAQARYPERLVVELVLDAIAAGARVVTHATVTGIETDSGAVCGVVYEKDGRRLGAASATVVNAAGPWVDAVLGPIGAKRLIGGTQGTHLVAAPFPGAPAAAVYAEARSDRRPFFVVPWNGLTLIGTTDERFDGDPADARPSAAECRYLAAETERLFSLTGPLAPFVRYAMTGVRPLPYTPGGSTGSITRRHLIHAHAGIRGLYSIIGGKLTTHRALAEDVSRRLKRRLGLGSSSPTRERPLPGALEPEAARELESELAARFAPEQVRRLWRIYGGAARSIAERAGRSAESAMAVAPGSAVLVAELEHAIEHERAETLIDLMARRTMAGLYADRGLGTAPGAARWLVRLGIWDNGRAEAELAGYRRHAERMLPTF